MKHLHRIVRRCGVLLKQAGTALRRFWDRLGGKGTASVPIGAEQDLRALVLVPTGPQAASTPYPPAPGSGPEQIKNETITNHQIQLGGEPAQPVAVFESTGSARLYIGLIPPAKGITVLLRELGS